MPVTVSSKNNGLAHTPPFFSFRKPSGSNTGPSRPGRDTLRDFIRPPPSVKISRITFEQEAYVDGGLSLGFDDDLDRFFGFGHKIES